MPSWQSTRQPPPGLTCQHPSAHVLHTSTYAPPAYHSSPIPTQTAQSTLTKHAARHSRNTGKTPGSRQHTRQGTTEVPHTTTALCREQQPRRQSNASRPPAAKRAPARPREPVHQHHSQHHQILIQSAARKQAPYSCGASKPTQEGGHASPNKATGGCQSPSKVQASSKDKLHTTPRERRPNVRRSMRACPARRCPSY